EELAELAQEGQSKTGIAARLDLHPGEGRLQTRHQRTHRSRNQPAILCVLVGAYLNFLLNEMYPWRARPHSPEFVIPPSEGRKEGTVPQMVSTEASPDGSFGQPL